MIANKQPAAPSCPACNGKCVTARLILSPGRIIAAWRCSDCSHEFGRLQCPADDIADEATSTAA
jgi:ribosomal protein L37AE/L43A